MKQLIREALKGILAMDDEVSHKMADYGIAVLAGEVGIPYDPPLPRVLRHKEVMRLLKVNNSTLHCYIRDGLLERIYGTEQNAIGISLESYNRMLENGRKAHEATNI